MRKYNILFVCLGNICRSPAAEGIMKAIVKKEGMDADFYIDSAGTYGGHRGEKADWRICQAASNRGYDLTSISRQITGDDFEKFDMIVVMDDSNYERVHRMAPDPEATGKIYRMRDFFHHSGFDHVPDPYYEGQEGFEIVLDILEEGCEGLFEYINSNRV